MLAKRIIRENEDASVSERTAWNSILMFRFQTANPSESFLRLYSGHSFTSSLISRGSVFYVVKFVQTLLIFVIVFFQINPPLNL